jgi:hypothetical protein
MENKKLLVGLILTSLLSFSVVPYFSVSAQTCDPEKLVPVSYGQRGTAVRNAQACLIEAGYDIPAGATGYYGSQTREAVKQFYADWYGSWSGNSLGPKGVAKLKEMLTGEVGGGEETTKPSQPTISTEVLMQVIALLLAGQKDAALALLQSSGLGVSTPSTPSVTGEVTVSLASDNPPAGTLIAEQTNASLLKFVVSNKTSNSVTINSIKVKRGGVSSDSTLSNVYLFANGVRVSDPASISQSYANFTGLSVQVPAGGSVTFEVRADVAQNTSGQTVSMSLVEASHIGGVTVSGNFPISGNIFTIATTPSDFAYISFSDSNAEPSSGTVNAGTNQYTVYRDTVNVNNRDVVLKSLRLRMIGSISPNDLKNFKLFIDGTEVASASLGSDNYLSFVPANPVTLKSGPRTIEVRADIVGGSTRQFSFSLRYPSDIEVYDSQYNVGVKVSNFYPINTGTLTIAGGSLTVQSLPLSDSFVVKGSRSVLAKFEFRAYGEPVKIESLTVTSNDDLRNGAIYVNGSQVGPTLNISSSTDTTFSNLNFIVNPGTPAIVEIMADVVKPNGSDVSASTLAITLKKGSNNAQATQSLNLLEVPGSNISTSPLSVVSGQAQLLKNASYGDPTFVKGKQNAKIASFVIVGSQYEDITVNSFTLNLSTTSVYQNLYLSVNPSDVRGTPASSNNFSLNLTILKGGQQIVDVFADILSSAQPNINVTSTASMTYIPKSGASVPPVTNIAGQTVSITDSGTLTATLHSDTPLSRYLVTGSTGEEFLRLKVSASQQEDLKIEEVKIVATTSVPGYHGNIVLTDGAVSYSRTTWDQIGNATSAVTFYGLNIVVPANQEKVLYIKTDINPYSSVQATTNVTSTFRVVEIKYRGLGSGELKNNTSTIAGNTMTIYRGNLLASFSPSGSRNVAPDYNNVTTFKVSANIKESGVTSVNLKSATFTIETNDFTTSTLTVALYDGNTVVTSTSFQWNDADTSKTVALTIDRDISITGKDYRLAIEGANIKSGTGARYFRVRVNVQSDITWRDGVVTSDISLDTQTNPLSNLRVEYNFSR